MAYRTKRRSHKRRSSRRRIGATSTRRRRSSAGKRKFNAMRVAGLIVGAVVPVLIGKMKIKDKPIDGKIIGAAAMAIGFFLPGFIKGDLAGGAADGLLASGGVILLQEFDVLNGIPVIAGWRELPTVSGAPIPAKEIHEQSQSSVFRPSITQIMSGMYRDFRD